MPACRRNHGTHLTVDKRHIVVLGGVSPAAGQIHGAIRYTGFCRELTVQEYKALVRSIVHAGLDDVSAGTGTDLAVLEEAHLGIAPDVVHVTCNQGIVHPNLTLAQEGILPGDKRVVLDGEALVVRIEVDGLRLAFVVIGPEGVLDGQVFQHQVVATLDKEQTAAAHGTYFGTQGRFAGDSRTGTRGVALVVGVGNHRTLAGSALDGEVVLIAYV